MNLSCFISGAIMGSFITLILISLMFTLSQPYYIQKANSVCSPDAYNQELTHSSIQKGELRCFYNISPAKIKKFKGI